MADAVIALALPAPPTWATPTGACIGSNLVFAAALRAPLLAGVRCTDAVPAQHVLARRGQDEVCGVAASSVWAFGCGHSAGVGVADVVDGEPIGYGAFRDLVGEDVSGSDAVVEPEDAVAARAWCAGEVPALIRPSLIDPRPEVGDSVSSHGTSPSVLHGPSFQPAGRVHSRWP